jgi:Kelch motif
MDDFDQFERNLAAALRSDADMSVARFEPATIAAAAVASTRRGTLRLAKGFSVGPTSNRWPIAVAIVVGVLIVGALLPAVVGRPSPTPSAAANPSLPGIVAPSSTPNATGPDPSAFPRTTGVWIATGTVGSPRRGDVAVRLLDGRVLVVGGAAGEFDPSPAAVYDPDSASWSATGTMAKPRDGSPATLLRDGRVLVGDEVYDPTNGTWSATGAMVHDGDHVTATLLRDGRVLATGTAGCELYDPDSGTWTKTGKMVAPRYYRPLHVLLPDGQVLVAGGLISDYGVDAAEIYDPATGTWSAIASMHAVRADGTATLLPDGRVLVTGGTDYQPSAPPELYDPVAGTWTATGDLASPGNRYQSAALLRDGTVLVSSARGSTDAELYDPGTGSWTPTGSLLREHAYSALTVLLDGTVLVAGGETGSSELYIPAGVSPPPAVAALPFPTATLIPTASPVPTPVPPQAGPVPPGARTWKVTVMNRSSQPATLFVAEEDQHGLLGPLVGSATPNVVAPGATVKVTFLLPAKGTDWAIFVNPGPNTGALLMSTDVPLAGEIRVGADGQPGWLSP